jgi:hypothetical protein
MENMSVLRVMAWIQIVVIITELMPLQNRNSAQTVVQKWIRRKLMNWIKVRDRLPEEKEPVIILLQDGQIFRGEIRMRQLLPEWWYYYDAGSSDIDILGLVYPIEKFEGLWFKGNPVIAWMPLPETPKEEK